VAQSVLSLGYEMDNGVIAVRFPPGARDFYFLTNVPIGTGAHTACCAMGTGGSFSGSKAVGTCR
jgi:hypothetical protein